MQTPSPCRHHPPSCLPPPSPHQPQGLSVMEHPHCSPTGVAAPDHTYPACRVHCLKCQGTRDFLNCWRRGLRWVHLEPHQKWTFFLTHLRPEIVWGNTKYPDAKRLPVLANGGLLHTTRGEIGKILFFLQRRFLFSRIPKLPTVKTD